MASGLEEEVFETRLLAFRDSVVSSPKGTRRILLRNILKLFGFKTRTQERIATLLKSMERVGLSVDPPCLDCGREDWVRISARAEASADPHNERQDVWFQSITAKQFASEKEVEIRFIIPLLERLGYSEEDRVDGCTIEMTIGSRKVRGEADFVLYDGMNRSRENVLLVIEAKRTGTRLEQPVEQARSYAMFLGAPFYLVTNGDVLRVFRFKSALESDVEVFRGTRETLGTRFHLLHGSISKPQVAELRRVLRNGNKTC